MRRRLRSRLRRIFQIIARLHGIFRAARRKLEEVGRQGILVEMGTIQNEACVGDDREFFIFFSQLKVTWNVVPFLKYRIVSMFS